MRKGSNRVALMEVIRAVDPFGCHQRWVCLIGKQLLHCWRLLIIFPFKVWHYLFVFVQLCDLLKSRLECPDFLEKLECAQASVYQNTVGMQRIIFVVVSNVFSFLFGFWDFNEIQLAWIVAEEGSSWDLVSENDLWEGVDSDEEDYVLVRQDDIVDGIACFMAAYLLSLKKTKVCIVFCIFFCYDVGYSTPQLGI